MALQANESVTPDSGPEHQDLRTVARPRCPMCAVAGTALHRDLADVVGGEPGRWSFSRCPDQACGMLWLDPAPVAAGIPLARRRYAADASVACLRGEARGRMLDVHCGDGTTLLRMREHGWDAEGVEPDLRAVEAARARGLRVAHGTLAAQGYPDDHFEAVALSHVVEQVHDPRAEIEECFRVLAPGGRLVIETPNAAALSRQVLGAHWRGLEPPRHLQVFTMAALARLARGCGFHVERMASTAKAARFFWAASIATAQARRRGAVASDRWGAGTRALAALGAASEMALLALVPDVGEELVVVARKPAVVREKRVEHAEEAVRSTSLLAPESAG